jgi:hypothetical protein
MVYLSTTAAKSSTLSKKVKAFLLISYVILYKIVKYVETQ